MAEEAQKLHLINSPHTIGGNGFTHSFPNYPRIVKEGLNSYRQRVELLPSGDFREGLLTVLDGIAEYHARCLQLLKNVGADSGLINALEHVPFERLKVCTKEWYAGILFIISMAVTIPEQ